jgi:hypothetical protein
MTGLAAAALTGAVGFAGAVSANAEAPGPGSTQCSPGQNHVGGGPGNSGPGDRAGAGGRTNRWSPRAASA